MRTTQRRRAEARDAELRRLSRLTRRITAAGAVGAAALGVGFATALPGHAVSTHTASAGATPQTTGEPAAGHHSATTHGHDSGLPGASQPAPAQSSSPQPATSQSSSPQPATSQPATGGSQLQPPPQAPSPAAPAAPPVTSGGS